MNSIPLTALAILLFSLSSTGQQAATSAGELQLGVSAYKTKHYEEAAEHFEKAVDLDGSNLNARLYLATACVSQYIPGVNSPENIRLAEKAIEQYQHILDADAERTQKINSAKGIAYLYLNMKKFDDAKKYHHLSSDLDPNDPEPYYSIGVIDWTECYQPRMEARAQLDLKPGDNLDPSNKDQRKICDEMKIRNTPAIEEGIDSLSKSIQLRPDYDDAMAYLNLMYREKADVECEDPVALDQDLKTADEWVDKIMATKKAKANKPAPTAPNPQ
jgi:tetratricopeptide (TPR) repeat protein